MFERATELGDFGGILESVAPSAWYEGGKIEKSWIRVAFFPSSFPNLLHGHIQSVIREQLVWSSLFQGEARIASRISYQPMPQSPAISWLIPIVFDNHTSSERHQNNHLLRPLIIWHVMGTTSPTPHDRVTEWKPEPEAEMRLQALSPFYRRAGVS